MRKTSRPEGETLAEFLALADPDRTRVVADIEAVRDANGDSPLIIVRTPGGKYAAVLAVMDLGYLDIDVHPFMDGASATASVFAMSQGRDALIPAAPTGTTSVKRPSAPLVAVLIGEQGTE